jgi:hypothetical protein
MSDPKKLTEGHNKRAGVNPKPSAPKPDVKPMPQAPKDPKKK